MSYDFYSTVACDHILKTVLFLQKDCPRCNGTGFYFDILLDANGVPRIVTGGDKLQQDLIKILIESMRDSGYGFNQEAILGLTDVVEIKTAIELEVTKVLQKLYTIQQERIGEGEVLPLDEQIERIGDLNIRTPLGSDPRRWFAEIKVVTALRTDVTITVPINIA